MSKTSEAFLAQRAAEIRLERCCTDNAALRADLDRAEAEKADAWQTASVEADLKREFRDEATRLRAELAAMRSVLIRVDEWWTSLPPGLRQDIEGSGTVPGCIAAVLTALQSHRRTEEAT